MSPGDCSSALAIVVAVLLVLVVVRYWPPWVADLGTGAADWVLATARRIWRHTGDAGSCSSC